MQGFPLCSPACSACRFIAERAAKHDPEDSRVWLFGLSRGAYTVRAVAGMINNCGILDFKHSLTDKAAQDAAVDEAYEIYCRQVPLPCQVQGQTLLQACWAWRNALSHVQLLHSWANLHGAAAVHAQSHIRASRMVHAPHCWLCRVCMHAVEQPCTAQEQRALRPLHSGALLRSCRRIPVNSLNE
jgi:hypothetical protein